MKVNQTNMYNLFGLSNKLFNICIFQYILLDCF